MVLGTIADNCRSPLDHTVGNITSEQYVDDVPSLVMPLFLQGNTNAIFQQNNTMSQYSLQGTRGLPSSPISGDLSPIEHVWNGIKYRHVGCSPPLPVQYMNCGKWLRGNGEFSLKKL
ncbi:hypothetical protein NPIL_511471 [Nephila pilipes]|uniref:Uncharacterized protein n=1 Tax=Nephila pilipes TaxID=299642 RepID=A0A8X6TA56_NEPPI|nr:hypothetical protein NPIL_511471 [Nephila pilipes]